MYLRQAEQHFKKWKYGLVVGVERHAVDARGQPFGEDHNQVPDAYRILYILVHPDKKGRRLTTMVTEEGISKRCYDPTVVQPLEVWWIGERLDERR